MTQDTSTTLLDSSPIAFKDQRLKVFIVRLQSKNLFSCTMKEFYLSDVNTTYKNKKKREEN